MIIKLRSIRTSDSQRLFSWVNDRELISNSHYFHPVSEHEHKKWFDSIFDRNDQLLLGIDICENENNELIGTCGLFAIDNISRKAELRIKIGEKKHWGKGAGSQAVQILCELGFRNLNLRKIWLKVFKDNVRAVRSYQKSGFIIEGELKEDIFIEGVYKDILMMAKFRDKNNGED